MTAEKIGQCFPILSVSIGITDKMNAADLLCTHECCQTRDRTNGHLVDSSNLLIEIIRPSVKPVVYAKAYFRLMKVTLKSKYFDHLCDLAL